MRRFKIVIINGIASNGKDTFIEFIKEKTRVMNHSSIDTVRHACRVFVGPNPKKGDAERKLLSKVKQAWIEYNNGPFIEIKDICTSLEGICFSGILFLHIREPEEIEKIKNHFSKVTTLLIQGLNTKVPDNDSDKKVFDMTYDYVIDNSKDVEEFKKQAFAWYDLFINSENKKGKVK